MYPVPRAKSARHKASRPRSPVRARTTVSTGVTQTFPSPIFPVRAASTARRWSCPLSLVYHDLHPDLGHEVDGVLRTPVDLGVPLCRPKPCTSLTVIPSTPIRSKAALTSSRVNGLTIAVTSFIADHPSCPAEAGIC